MALKSLKKILNVKQPFGIWKQVLGVILSNPKIAVPFAIISGFEVLALWVLSCSPHFPFSILLAPPIKSIWGPVFLHYPYIYELLPRIFYYAKLILGVFVGSVTTAMAILMVARVKAGRPIELKAIFLEVLKRYLTLIILTGILYACVHFVMKQPQVLLFKYFRGHAKLLFVGPKFWLDMFLPVLTFILALILQGLFVYSIPYVVLKGKKLLPALFSGFMLFFKNLAKTLLVVFVPMLLYIPVTMTRGNLNVLADKFSPEIVLPVLMFGIAIGTFVVDCLVTVATTFIFLEAADEK